ncbi:MAG: ABC transporter substrate-binding protein [Terrimicrobiaceae bacterium]|nr:ABC transporter substrate-binding protein [Terrimicrobiaceae bacterium]
MRVARFFIYGVPILLLALIIGSFVNSAALSRAKKNEMSIGVLGEPSTLNPIKQADGVAAQVFSTMFNGLLKYDENLEIIGDLAKSWLLSQTTTVFLRDDAAAAEAVRLVESWRAEWADWQLEAATADGSLLKLAFTEPGLDASKAIVERLPQDTLAPRAIFRIETEDNSRTLLDEFRAAHPDAAIARFWIESGAAFELTASPDLRPVLEKWFADRKGRVTELEQTAFLAEPVVLFTLRDGVRWHDGKPFTSRDVEFTYRMIMSDEVASPRKADFDLILSVETPGLRTVRVTYRRPYSPALNSWMISILPAHILDGKSQDWWGEHFNRSPIGTGPYKFDQWKTNEFVRVVRNPDFFESPAPWLDAVVFHSLPDQLALRLAFETRQVDFWAAEPWTVATFQNDPRFEVFSAPASSYTYIGWNLNRPLFQDVRVRQALAHAVDVPSMVRYILYGNGVQSTGIFTPQMWFFNPRVAPFTYNPEKASQMLDEAGWIPGPDGIRVRNGERLAFTIITNNANEVRRDIATLVQDGFRRVGVDVRVELYEWAVFLKNHINKGNFDAMVLGWSLPPDFDQFQIWHSSQTNPEQLNVVGYKNPEVDKLLEQIRQEYNRDRIIALAGLIQSTIYRDQPYLFLYVPQSTSVVWRDSYRIRRPGPDGNWLDTPLEMTKAGWSYWSDWFYRPEFADRLPQIPAIPQ